MAIDYTTSELINRIKRKITVPTSQNFFLPDNIVSYASDTLQGTVVGMIISVMEDFFVTQTDTPVVSGTSEYRMPQRAVGGMLRDVVMVDVNGNEVDVPRIQPEVVKTGAFTRNGGYLAGILVRDDKVILVPTEQPFLNMTLRFKWMRRPNDLIITSKAGKIVAVNVGANQVTLQSTPSFFTTSMTYDIIRGTPIFTSEGDDLTVTNISGNTVTFSVLPSGTTVGSYLSEAGTSPIPQIPYEAHQALAALTAATMLDATGDKKNAEVIDAKGRDLIDTFLKTVSPRVEGLGNKVNNRTGIMSGVGRSGFFGW